MIEKLQCFLPAGSGCIRAAFLAVLVHAVLFFFLCTETPKAKNQSAIVSTELWPPKAIIIASPSPPQLKRIVEKPKSAALPLKNNSTLLRKKRKEKPRKLQHLRKIQTTEKNEKKLRASPKVIFSKKRNLLRQKKKSDTSAKEKINKEREKQAAASAIENYIRRKRHSDEVNRLINQAASRKIKDKPKVLCGDPDYAQKIASKIKSNIIFSVPKGFSKNAEVEFDVQLFSDGSIKKISLKNSSQVPGFDRAVKKAIEKSSPYPKDKNGSIPSSFVGSHKLKDQ
jgi:colicin import membrane protein